ncbi:hypothetical protein IU427_12625 [Nocardia beijingensis]|uniref:hypothetical protein n=1 Tax=Nocardia beijingensis TaxID=95162 RepID=UPI001894293E|nr:hypothetical protein [Nocardia beijingensis]MBF6466019.1 hypothetical protein [Nocardia beijingensis]
MVRAALQVVDALKRLTKREAEGVAGMKTGAARASRQVIDAHTHGDADGELAIRRAAGGDAGRDLCPPPPDRASLAQAVQRLDAELNRRFGESGPTDEELYDLIAHRRLSRLEQYAIIDRRIDETATSLGRDSAEFREQMRRELKDALDGKPLAIRVREDKLLAILAEGRIRGIRNPVGNRAHAEEEWFGPHVHDNPPVYGYVAVDGVRPSQVGMIDALSELNYGDNQIYLKPEVRSRTTITFGDSLVERERAIPSPIDNPSEYSYGAGVHDLAPIGRDYLGADFRAGHFFEAQMFDLTTADIDFIGLHQPPSAAVREALDRSGIDWRVLDNRTIAAEGSPAERAAAIERTSQDLEHLRQVHPVMRSYAEPIEAELRADLRVLNDSAAGDGPAVDPG